MPFVISMEWNGSYNKSLPRWVRECNSWYRQCETAATTKLYPGESENAIRDIDSVKRQLQQNSTEVSQRMPFVILIVWNGSYYKTLPRWVRECHSWYRQCQTAATTKLYRDESDNAICDIDSVKWQLQQNSTKVSWMKKSLLMMIIFLGLSFNKYPPGLPI